jgi:hypothetical protein
MFALKPRGFGHAGWLGRGCMLALRAGVVYQKLAYFRHIGISHAGIAAVVFVQVSHDAAPVVGGEQAASATLVQAIARSATIMRGKWLFISGLSRGIPQNQLFQPLCIRGLQRRYSCV